MELHDPIVPYTQKRRSLINSYFAWLHELRASDAFLMRIMLFIASICLLFTLAQLSMNKTVPIPATGGILSEGVVGTPRFVNPVLAATQADRDLVALVYDGLMRLGNDGTLVPSIAESVTVSEDGLTYNVILKQDIYFHDGTQLTAKDIIFTVLRIQDPALNSPLFANWSGITVEEIGEFELNFVLPEAYSPFIENLTFGILPEHIWKNANSEEFPFSQYNSEPVGSGPYRIQKIVRNTSGIPEMYTLSASTDYHGGTPKIETITLSFFSSEQSLIDAFREGRVESVVGVDYALIPEFQLTEKLSHIERMPLPRTYAVFINQNKSAALRDPAARKALDSALDRKALIDTTLGGYANVLTSPIPYGFGITASNTPTEASADSAREILREGGWEMNENTQLWEKKIDGVLTPLQFSISTGNTSTLGATAEFIRASWVAMGADVTVKQFEQSDLTQSVIRPRDYETLLFATQLERSLDYYSFWHSSQRNDPGYNIALYANITTDSILSEMRRSTNTDIRNEAIQKFAYEIQTETPAIFLYAPELLYIVPNKVTGMTFKGVSDPSERWSSVTDWYIRTESIWPFFTH